MRAVLIIVAVILALTGGDPASAGLSKKQFEKLELDGFRLGMSLAETDAIVRNRADLEEPNSELFAAFNCGSLLPKDSNGDYEQIQNRKIPISYYIDDHARHRYDIFFESTPSGTHIYAMYSFNFMGTAPWDTYLKHARSRYGEPDIVRAKGPRMSAIWCEHGDKKCDSDDFRQRMVLNWNRTKDHLSNSDGSGFMIWEKAHRNDEGDEDEYAAIAEHDPAKGRLLFRQCIQAAGTFADEAEIDGHLGNLAGGLPDWSAAVSEPRLIDDELLKATGFDAEGLIARHNCAIRRQAGHTDLNCSDLSEFRWMRTKGPVSLFALRDTSVKGYTTRTGTLSKEKRYYCAVWQIETGTRMAWRGESLLDFYDWFKSHSDGQTDQTPSPNCRPEF